MGCLLKEADRVGSLLGLTYPLVSGFISPRAKFLVFRPGRRQVRGEKAGGIRLFGLCVVLYGSVTLALALRSSSNFRYGASQRRRSSGSHLACEPVDLSGLKPNRGRVESG